MNTESLPSLSPIENHEVVTSPSVAFETGNCEENVEEADVDPEEVMFVNCAGGAAVVVVLAVAGVVVGGAVVGAGAVVVVGAVVVLGAVVVVGAGVVVAGVVPVWSTIDAAAGGRPIARRTNVAPVRTSGRGASPCATLLPRPSAPQSSSRSRLAHWPARRRSSPRLPTCRWWRARSSATPTARPSADVGWPARSSRAVF